MPGQHRWSAAVPELQGALRLRLLLRLSARCAPRSPSHLPDFPIGFRMLRRRVARISASFETAELKGEGRVGGVSLGSFDVSSGTRPTEGDWVQVKLKPGASEPIEVTGFVHGLMTTESGCWFRVQLEHIPDGYLRLYEEILFG